MATKKAAAENDVSLPFPALQLLAPPVRLVSAAVWQAVQRRDVLQYGAVEEFVTSVCESVPGVLTFRHQGKLTLGLRGRLILELLSCSEAQPDRESIRRHMERFRVPSPCPTAHKLKKDVKIERTVSCFQELVETLLQDPAVRLQFFKEEFPEEYGSNFDQELEKLLWEFLIRLDQLLPVPNLAQTVSWLSTAPPVLEECARAATQPQLLRTILQFQTCLGHLEAAASLPPKMGDSILTSLSLPLSGRPAADRPAASDQGALPGASAAQGEEGSARRDGVKRKQPGGGGGREDGAITEEDDGNGGPPGRGSAKRGRRSTKKRCDENGRQAAAAADSSPAVNSSPAGGPSPHADLSSSSSSSFLLHQPTVLLRRLDAAALGAAHANTGDRHDHDDGDEKKKKKKKKKNKNALKSDEGSPGRRGAEPSRSDDKENCHVLPGITTSTITEARPSAGDSDDVIGDSEDEATKNFKGMLFVKRYYKTKHDTYVPTLREFWKPWMVRPNLLSPR